MSIDIETAPSTDLVVLDETDSETTEDGGNTNLAYAGVAVASAALTVVTMKYVLPTVHGWLGRLVESSQQIAEEGAKIDEIVAEATTPTEKKTTKVA